MPREGKILAVRWWDGRIVGHLLHTGPIYFTYAQEWVESGHNLSPLVLELRQQPINCLAEGCSGVPGFIADSLPDAWGLRVASSVFAEKGWGVPTTMKLLAWIGRRGMGALSFHPAVGGDKGASNWLAKVTAESLAKEARSLLRGEPTAVIRHLVEGGTAGGAYPKALVMEHADGTLSLARETTDPRDRPSLLKLDIAQPMGATCVECAYMHMAGAAGVVVPDGKLVNGAGGRHHLLIRRFDRVGARHLHMPSLSGLWQRPKAGMGYEDLFRAAVRLGLPGPELRQLARRMVFNVLAANHDDHGRNHAFLYDETTRSWRASPAFDLTYVPGMLSCGLTISGEVHPTIDRMEAFLAGVGISAHESRTIVGDVTTAVEHWMDFADEVGVPRQLRIGVAEAHAAALAQSGVKRGTKLRAEARQSAARLVRDRITGLTITESPPGFPSVTSEQVRAALTDFP